ncbi:hypothetical protein [Micrococcus terreus]|uniref:hypothetical protein n=1 Tax=Micrococcus terreus TaxID=574650 RepID=UPI00254E6BFC|nr:hypothetical protein [Micrococcus terreus]MDK7701507.1 hypothetical protein [Micrococcus terreus]WOO98207.1 hypothetical protein R3I42_03430 [Micrococcus terreus]
MSPEQKVKDAIEAELKHANLRFDRARLDLLRPESAPYSLRDAADWRREMDRKALAESFAAVGRGLGALFSTLRSVANAFSEGVVQSGGGEDA